MTKLIHVKYKGPHEQQMREGKIVERKRPVNCTCSLAARSLCAVDTTWGHFVAADCPHHNPPGGHAWG